MHSLNKCVPNVSKSSMHFNLFWNESKKREKNNDYTKIPSICLAILIEWHNMRGQSHRIQCTSMWMFVRFVRACVHVSVIVSPLYVCTCLFNWLLVYPFVVCFFMVFFFVSPAPLAAVSSSPSCSLPSLLCTRFSLFQSHFHLNNPYTSNQIEVNSIWLREKFHKIETIIKQNEAGTMSWLTRAKRNNRHGLCMCVCLSFFSDGTLFVYYVFGIVRLPIPFDS